jgi:hypothetical protein
MSKVKKKACHRGSREKGAMLAEAIMAIMVMMILAVPYMSKLAAKSETIPKGYEAVSALCLAEAGVEKAIAELNKGAWLETEGISTNLTMAIDGFETPGGAIVGDLDITLLPFDQAARTRLVEATGTVRLADFSELAKTVRVVLQKADEYVIASWDELSASSPDKASENIRAGWHLGERSQE